MKDIKNTELKFHVINLKIHSELENKQELYYDAMQEIFNLDDFQVNIGNKSALILKKLEYHKFSKNQLEDLFLKFEYDNYGIFIGEFVKFKIEDENDKYYDIEEKTLKSGDPNSKIKPNAHEVMFYFIPSIHRVFLPLDSKVSPKKVKLFFDKVLFEIYLGEQFFNVEIAKSQDEINRIFKFKKLKRLNLNISYTNDDLGNDEKMFFDALLKDAKVNKVKTTYDAERNESLNMNSMIIKGGIELSKENGEVIAVGVNEYGINEVVNTANKFEQFNFSLKGGVDSLMTILKQGLKKWRE